MNLRQGNEDKEQLPQQNPEKSTNDKDKETLQERKVDTE